jgi:PAS domain-containing protein/DNA-binding CsgD family transcriptional regulator
MLASPAHDPDVIAGFYEAAARRQGWGDAWASLCTSFRADTGLLFRRSQPSAQPFILAARNWPLETHDLALDARVRIDPAWLDDVAGAGRASASPDTLCATVSLEGTAVIGMGLKRDAGAFTEAERLALDGMGRHVAAAVRLEALLAAERIASAVRGAAMDVAPHGIVVLNGRGAILFANASARRIAAESGVLLGGGTIGLVPLHTGEAEKLEALVTSVSGGGPGGCVAIGRPGGLPPLAVTVDPLSVTLAEPGAAYVMVTLRDLGATADAAPSHLMDLFGLTAAEAGIVPQLLCGESASLIAQSRGVAVGTVKAQAGRVLAKTGAPNLRALSLMIAALGCG